jgi:NADP-dependent aldehyde dehydrogenase
MELHGKNIIAGEAVESGASPSLFTARGNFAKFEEASEDHIRLALEAAAAAAQPFRDVGANRRAQFIERIADEIQALGDALLSTANRETSLPVAERLVGERGRTINQLRLFAALVREGSWVDARIDRAIPDRKPVAKPDVRRLLIPLGPVVVFSASNFPLAFSVAGGDTASAFAAGCPVVVKAHPAHPATSELTARAIVKAARDTGMPAGVFSLLQSSRNEIAIALVKHPLLKAVAFTGSLRGGRAVFDAAVRRPDPIPVYAEMGSINPVFILPGALRERGNAIAEGMKAAITLGTGQFCTCPGLGVGIGEDFARFSEAMTGLFKNAFPSAMLHPGILQSYESGVERLAAIRDVVTIESAFTPDPARIEARPALFLTNVETFDRHHQLGEELFGPSSVLVQCQTRDEVIAVARNLDGHLTATIHGTRDDLSEYADLVSILESKVGRLIFNGFPTGVEVCPAMHHGGPYPATTDSRSTSVGTAAVLRFARPVAYQNFPQSALPSPLQDANPDGIWRLVDGQWNKDAL